MALNFIKEARVRGTSALYTVKDGVVRSVAVLYQMTGNGLKLVWQGISSCFGGGYWKGDEPWNGSDTWNGNYN